MGRWLSCLGIGIAFGLMSQPSTAQEILFASYSDLQAELGALIDFENYPKISSPGRALDDVQAFDGAMIAEKFRGQAVHQTNGFDALALTPEAPLRLEPGAPGQNLAIEFVFFMSNQLMGTAPPGFPERDAGGEGAVSILFERDQSALGFRIASEPLPKTPTPKGKIAVSFYRRDGHLIDAVEVELEWMLGSYGFRRAGEIEDIAGITITNRDPQGVMIDDVIFDRDLVLGLFTR